MRRLLSLLLSSVVLFSLAMPVFAQESTGSEDAPKVEKKEKKKAKKAKKEKKHKKAEEAAKQ